jgi:hypothetical protein
MPDEHQPGCFALEEERGANWKGGGGPYRLLKKLNQVCDRYDFSAVQMRRFDSSLNVAGRLNPDVRFTPEKRTFGGANWMPA